MQLLGIDPDTAQYTSKSGVRVRNTFERAGSRQTLLHPPKYHWLPDRVLPSYPRHLPILLLALHLCNPSARLCRPNFGILLSVRHHYIVPNCQFVKWTAGFSFDALKPCTLQSSKSQSWYFYSYYFSNRYLSLHFLGVRVNWQLYQLLAGSRWWLGQTPSSSYVRFDLVAWLGFSHREAECMSKILCLRLLQPQNHITHYGRNSLSDKKCMIFTTPYRH